MKALSRRKLSLQQKLFSLHAEIEHKEAESQLQVEKTNQTRERFERVLKRKKVIGTPALAGLPSATLASYRISCSQMLG